MNTTVHTFRIAIKQRGELPEIDGGLITFTGEDYDTFDEQQALDRVLPEIDFSNAQHGIIRWRNKLIPLADLGEISVELVSKAKPG